MWPQMQSNQVTYARLRVPLSKRLRDIKVIEYWIDFCDFTIFEIITFKVWICIRWKILLVFFSKITYSLLFFDIFAIFDKPTTYQAY